MSNYDTSLYKISLKQICQHINSINSSNVKSLPPCVLTDLLEYMLKYELYENLYSELSDLDLFIRILRYGSKRQSIIKCVSELMIKYDICSTLCQHYFSYQADIRTTIEYGLLLSNFFSECGWLYNAIKVLTKVYTDIKLLVLNEPSYDHLLLSLNCAQKLLSVQAAFCYFKEASRTAVEALDTIDKLINLKNGDIQKLPSSLIAQTYCQLSVLHFHRSEYALSYEWSCRALQFLKQETPDKITIDVLRQAAKACIVKRKFQSANMLIKQAVSRAKKVFGCSHLKYSDALLDYGFFLLNVDSITKSVNVYKQALEIKQQNLGTKNIYVAIAHEDLSYALYVLEYSSGNFDAALNNIEICIDIMADLIKDNPLMQASAKRVKALILEEIALDSMIAIAANNPNRKSQPMLKESEELHLAALKLSLEAFGENNVQTAKHYGNLGRLYQSMCNYEKAEKMHQKAIQIKTDLLGCYDYEVGLSIGHLASLYNYHMEKYREAEQLYLKSLQINLRLFGPAYSGLEYDYRGLCHVYEILCDRENLEKYAEIMEDWRVLRAENDEGQRPLYSDLNEDGSMEEVTRKFFEMTQNEEHADQV